MDNQTVRRKPLQSHSIFLSSLYHLPLLCYLIQPNGNDSIGNKRFFNMGRHKGTRIWYDNQDGKSILRKYKQLWSPWKISRSWTMDHQYHDSVSELWQRSSSKTPKNSKRNGTLHPITWTIPHPMPSIYHKLQLLPPRCPLSLYWWRSK